MKLIGVLYRKKLIRSVLNTPFMEMGKVWQEDFLLLSIFSFAIMVARTSWCGIICKLFLLSIMVVGLQCTLSHETFLSGVWVRPSSLTSGCWEFSERFVSSCIKFFQQMSRAKLFTLLYLNKVSKLRIKFFIRIQKAIFLQKDAKNFAKTFVNYP